MCAHPALPSQSPPEQIGRYKVLERIGRGAMGLVYRARDEAMGRDVAIKLLAADLEDEPEIRARFLREAEAAARLSHPNIITIFDVGEERNRFYIVMELLRGSTLTEVVKRSGLPTLESQLDLMIQLCSGLGAAHNVGVYHRDIKPGNLFVRPDGVLKILDFGIARLASSTMTSVGFIVGTPDYMSPEQARGDPVDARSDIFSAGSVCYFMLSGRKPFFAPDLPTIFRRVEFEDPTPLSPSEAPPDLARVIMRAMSKDAASRHQNCQELKSELSKLRDRYIASGLGGSAWPKEVDADVDADDAPTSAVMFDGETVAGPSAPTPTEDTVDYLPFPGVTSEDPGVTHEDEDTVALPPPGGVSAFADRVGSWFSALVGRLRKKRGRDPVSQNHRKR